MPEETCIFCGSSKLSLCGNTYDSDNRQYQLMRCHSCRAVCLSPRPEKDDLEQAYASGYYGGEKGEKFVPLIEHFVGFFRDFRARGVERLIPLPARVLDIGCGSGGFLALLAEKGYQTYGTERPGEAAVRAARVEGINVVTDVCLKDIFAPQSFDAITMWHVFEHLEEPKQMLNFIHSALKPGGYLFMSLPNIDSLQARAAKGHWLHLDPPRHLFFLGPKELIGEITALGFSLVSVSHFSLEQNVIGMQQSLLNACLQKRELLFESLKGNKDYCREYSALFLWLQKLFFVLSFPFFTLLALVEACAKRGGTTEFIFRRE